VVSGIIDTADNKNKTKYVHGKNFSANANLFSERLSGQDGVV
jgi:hypothetical protein